MKALLLIAHGSRLPAANREVVALGQRLGARLAGEFDLIDCAFLELADPDIGAAIDDCVARGCLNITLLPYFLASGRHLQEDIPAILRAKQARHPQLRIQMAPYLGQADQLIETLAGLALGR